MIWDHGILGGQNTSVYRSGSSSTYDTSPAVTKGVMNAGNEMCIKKCSNNYQYEIDLSTGTYSWEAILIWLCMDLMIISFSKHFLLLRNRSFLFPYLLAKAVFGIINTRCHLIPGKQIHLRLNGVQRIRILILLHKVIPEYISKRHLLLLLLVLMRLPYYILEVLYINGNEVFLDNIPSGDITSSTTFTKSYVNTQVTIIVSFVQQV